jgi:hypothetical protein
MVHYRAPMNPPIVFINPVHTLREKGRTIPVTCRGGPYGCEKSRLPHFLDSRFTNGGEVVSLTRRSPFNPQEDS